MKRKTICVLMALAIILSITGISVAAKKQLECKTEKVDGEKVTLDCGDSSKKIEIGATYILKRKLEGC